MIERMTIANTDTTMLGECQILSPCSTQAGVDEPCPCIHGRYDGLHGGQLLSAVVQGRIRFRDSGVIRAVGARSFLRGEIR